MSTQLALLLIVMTMSSPAANVLDELCVCSCSVLLTLFAVPPSAEVLTLNVAVHVPETLRVVVLLMVPAYGMLIRIR